MTLNTPPASVTLPAPNLSLYERWQAWFLTAMAVLGSLAVSHSDTTLAPPIVSTLISRLNWVLLSLTGILLICGCRVRTFSRARLALLTCIIVYFCLNNFYRYDGNIFDIRGVCGFGLLLEFTFIEKRVIVSALHHYKRFLTFACLYGVACYADFLLQLHVLPHTVVNYYSSIGESFYINYFLAYIIISPNDAQIRLCGLFNEPGYLATILALLLIADRLNLRKRENWVYFVTGLCTFSMAFWSILLLGIVLFYARRMRTIVVALIIAGAAFFVVRQVEFRNPAVQKLVERFQWDANKGRFKGDNRQSNSFHIVEQNFYINNGSILFGAGAGYSQAMGADATLSYRTYVIDFGWVGFLSIFGLLALSALLCSKKQWSAFIFVVCFMASIYQRPGVLNIHYLLVLYGCISLMTYSHETLGDVQFDK